MRFLGATHQYQGVLAVGFSADSTGTFDDVAHLEEIAEVVLLLIDDVAFDRLLALESSPRLPVTTTATATQICQTMGTAIVAEHPPFNTGGATAIPAKQT